MSATNRGAERLDADNYPTPSWCVRRLLEAVPELPGGHWLEPCVGEGAIVKAVLDVRQDVYFTGIDTRDVRKVACDAGAKRVLVGDYLNPGVVHTKGPTLLRENDFPLVTITNPPFSLGYPIAQKGILNVDGWFILLLRLNFLGSGTKDGRSPWLRTHMPDVATLPNRPAFVASLKCIGVKKPLPGYPQIEACGWKRTQPLEAFRPKLCPECRQGKVQTSTTDATEYAWMLWPPGKKDRFKGETFILAETSEEERAIAIDEEAP
jgi:hypothetical protein